MAQQNPILGSKMLQPLMPEDMRSELIAALKVQNIQGVRSNANGKSFRRFPLQQSNISSPIVGNSEPSSNEDDKRRSMRLQAIQEIRSSEVSYLGQLDLLLKYFVQPLQDASLMNEKIHAQLFGQLDTIRNLGQELLKKLDDNLEHVVRAFVDLGPFFKLYSVYAFDYRNSLCTLQNLMQKNSALKRFVTETESRPEVQMKLISLLITPIQRIPRYKLLLQQVLLYTSPSDAEHKPLQGAIELVEQSVSHINTIVEDFENTQRLINIQRAMTNSSLKLVRPGRKVLKEGILRKLKTDGNTSRKYCILMSDMFMYCRIVKDFEEAIPENGLDCSCIFPLKKCKVVELFRGNFKITCSGDGTIFTSVDADDCRAWYVAVKDAIEQHVQCRKTLRKLSSNRKPMRKKHLHRLEPEDDYLWLLRRKTVSPERIRRRSRIWPFSKMDCLKLNHSFGEENKMMSPVVVRPGSSTPTRPWRTTSARMSENMDIGTPVQVISPIVNVAQEGTSKRQVQFRLPTTLWRY